VASVSFNITAINWHWFSIDSTKTIDSFAKQTDFSTAHFIAIVYENKKERT